MDLSVIIVSYNVKTYLDQCLRSVQRASENLKVEVIVIDNCSKDDTLKHIKNKFPWVHCIENKVNLGFGKANNIGAKKAIGDYVLYLNPDTVVGENNFKLALKQFNEHPNLGSLGCRMIDGKGNFLPESKRGFPTPLVAIYRLFGLARLFPKSKRWAGYYMGHIDESENAAVEIHCGAWMMLSRQALIKSVGFDEDFFMYGEDIDLSHRIGKFGFETRYFSDSPIIHYKGESTKHDSWAYVKNFHVAMDIFAKKHFTSGVKAFSILIRTGIYAKAFSSILKRWLELLVPLFLTAAIGYFLANEFTDYWETNHRYPQGGEYPRIYRQVILPTYLIIWTLSMFISGAYSINSSIFRYFTGFLLSTSVLLSSYALLPLDLRFSRILILISSLLFFISFIIVKTFLKFRSSEGVFGLVNETIAHVDRVDSKKLNSSSDYDISIDEIVEQCDYLRPTEIHFYPQNIDFHKIIKTMILLRKRNLRYRMIYSSWTLGSDDYQRSSNHAFPALLRPSLRRAKYLLSMLFTIFIIVTLPVCACFPRGRYALKNLPAVLLRKKTWVGYIGNQSSDLPFLKKGVFCHTHLLKDKELQKFADIRYAHHWRPEFDIYGLFNGSI
jgi:GT2 family glycosyltransferase